MPLFLKVGDDMVFTVNGNKWNLEFARPGSKDLQRSDGTYTFGTTDGGLKTVFIMSGMSDYMTDKVLVHELSHVHAIEYDYFIPIEVEEIVCDFMSLYGRSVIYMADDIMGKILGRIA